jgi:hypothetical protein
MHFFAGLLAAWWMPMRMLAQDPGRTGLIVGRVRVDATQQRAPKPNASIGTLPSIGINWEF